MKKNRSLFLASLVAASCAFAVPDANANGIYGLIVYGTESVVESPTVVVQKWNGSSWVTVDSTPASACGYYTYDINDGWGTYQICVNGTYDLRDANVCSTEVEDDQAMGACDSFFFSDTGWAEHYLCASGGSSCL